MINSQILGYTIGIILMIIGATSLFPALMDYSDGHANATSFFLNSLAAFFLGSALILSNKDFPTTTGVRQTFLLTTLSWFFLALFGALPLYMSNLNLSFAEAFFESMSGITTTGSTVITKLETQSRGVLLWRSLLQFVGGIGIVAFAIILLPFLGVGGMQLFKTESSDKSDKIMPRSRDVLRYLMVVYIFLNALCTAVYCMLGMSFFDGLNHAMTTISTGGFSTSDSSFGYFRNPSLHYAGAFFMFLGGMPFFLFIKMFYRGDYNVWKDDQMRFYVYMLSIIIFPLTLWLVLNSDYTIGESFMYVSFNVISVITTTGFATTDYTLWGPFAAIVFLFITYLGACTGSTAGGIKVMRLDIILKSLILQINSLLYPNAKFNIRYQGRPVEPDLVMNILGFLGLYVATNVVITMGLTFVGLNFITALSGAATAIANVGPGIGPIIGPAGNFSTLPDAALWLLSLGMLLGRLEILTVLVLFTGLYWKN